MHPITRYIDRLGISQAEFGRRMDLSPQLITDVIKGRCHLGRETALRVVERTGGEITLHELATWEPGHLKAAS